MNKTNINKQLTINERGLYIHVPFCHALCAYCDFSKMHYIKSFIKPYLDSLKKEIESYDINDIKTIYIGGGTPSSLEIDELQYLLDIVNPIYLNNKIEEYTFECNVESVDKEKLELLNKYHISRLSFGLQSSNDDLLKMMNRTHTFKKAEEVIKLAKNIGFDNINVDLILGFKERDKKMLEKEIEDIISLDVSHISTYCLTIHENTKFYIDKYQSKDDDEMVDELNIVYDTLIKHGYINYEVSNYAKERHYMSKHNLIYWEDGQYYGVGLNASSYIDNKRYTNTKNIHKYINGHYDRVVEEVKKEDEFLYYIMLHLRLDSGIKLIDFQNKFGFDFLLLNKTIKKWERSSHILLNGDTICLTFKGRLILHTIVIDFLEEYEHGLCLFKK